MKNWSEMTLAVMAKRSDFVVLGITVFVAMVGSLLAIVLGGQTMWGTWVPLCFITIPPIHYLCREVLRLRRKMEELEKRLG
jgi:hypothetical protein